MLGIPSPPYADALQNLSCLYPDRGTTPTQGEKDPLICEPPQLFMLTMGLLSDLSCKMLDRKELFLSYLYME
jgi:hypothetical protein